MPQLFALGQPFFSHITLPRRNGADDAGGARGPATGEGEPEQAGAAGSASGSEGEGGGGPSSDSGGEGSEGGEGPATSAAAPPSWADDDPYARGSAVTVSRYLYDAEDAAAAGVRWEPRILFHAEDGQQFWMWRALLLAQKEKFCSESSLLARARHLGSPQRWAVLMSRAGHFAGALFEQGVPCAHKTFHRYVVRAGQGGRQSEKAPGAKSAGASLRRYNERAMDSDIRELLTQWAGPLAACDLIFLHAPGNSNARPFFGEGKQAGPLDRADARLRPVPFPTRRPTFSELKRCVDQLATLTLEPRAMPGTGLELGLEPGPGPEPEPERDPELEPELEPESEPM